MYTYLALLRGVNVGGKAMLKMANLASALQTAGFKNVRTYIQSGNILLDTDSNDKKDIAEQIKACIKHDFQLSVEVATFTAPEWKAIVAAAPDWWGKDLTWKHNILVLTEDIPMPTVVAAIGNLKPEIEHIAPGRRVLYQSLSLKMFGRTTLGKLASNPVYKKMTVRNFNTATKLSQLLD
jgi:uncharacterized protein (DUF1697 family)